MGKKAGAREVTKVCLFLTSYFGGGGQTLIVRLSSKYLEFIVVVVLRHDVTMCTSG